MQNSFFLIIEADDAEMEVWIVVIKLSKQTWRFRDKTIEADIEILILIAKRFSDKTIEAGKRI